MAVPSAYMQSVKNLSAILGEIQQAQVPQKFTVEFLKTLGFTSSNDRSILGVLKALDFLDQAGVPTERYRGYRNKAEAPYVLAAAIRQAYSDLFLARENAESLANDRIKGILATKVDKGDAVLDKMAMTFRALVGLAKWDRPSQQQQQQAHVLHEETPGIPSGDAPAPIVPDARVPVPQLPLQYAYNIQIQLPATKDISVYNAIFKSIREHLL